MARGSSRAMTESERVIKGKKSPPSDPAYEPVAMDGDQVIRKGAYKSPQLAADFQTDKDFERIGQKYLRAQQELTDGSTSSLKDGDPYWSSPASKEAPRQRWLEIGDEAIRGSLRMAGFKDWDKIEGVGPDRLMASWMLSSRYWDFSGKVPKQIAPIPKRFER